MMYLRMNRRNIVILCLIWCFANFSKCVAYKDESQYGNGDTNCGSEVTTCTIIGINSEHTETQIEKPPIKNLDVEPNTKPQTRLQVTSPMVFSRQKRSDRGDSDVWKQQEVSKVTSRQKQGHENLSCLLVEEMTSNSKKSSSAPRGATRASRKRSRKQSKHFRAPSNPSSPINPSSIPSASRASSKASAQQSESQNEPNDNSLTSEELSRTPYSETSTLPDRNSLPQPRGLLLGKLFSNNAEESSNQKETDEKNVPSKSNAGETASQDLETLKREMEQRNQNTQSVPFTDSLGIRNRELKTFGATRGKEQRRNPNGNQNIRKSKAFVIQNQDLRTFSDTTRQGQRKELTRTSVVTGVPGQKFTSVRKKNCNDPNLELLNEPNRKNNQPITFLPLDHQHMSESDRAILKTLNDDSVKYSELSETHTDISHILNSNCDSIIIGPSNDDDLFVVEHESEDTADDFKEQDTKNVHDDNAPIDLVFIKYL